MFTREQLSTMTPEQLMVAMSIMQKSTAASTTTTTSTEDFGKRKIIVDDNEGKELLEPGTYNFIISEVKKSTRKALALSSKVARQVDSEYDDDTPILHIMCKVIGKPGVSVPPMFLNLRSYEIEGRTLVAGEVLHETGRVNNDGEMGRYICKQVNGKLYRIPDFDRTVRFCYQERINVLLKACGLLQQGVELSLDEIDLICTTSLKGKSFNCLAVKADNTGKELKRQSAEISIRHAKRCLTASQEITGPADEPADLVVTD